MTQNRASLVISEDDERTVLAAIAQIEAILKNLVAFEGGERRTMNMMGQRNEPFARETHQLLQQNRAIVPPTLDVDEMRADLEAYDRLKRINIALQRLTTLCLDTEAALGSDVFEAALAGYTMLKVFGPSHGLEEQVKSLSARFASQGRRRSKPSTG
ncbi:hypothetical protein AB4059_05165 [Lysobacter sp. 2RAF19]